jgi:hypothetical protein
MIENLGRWRWLIRQLHIHFPVECEVTVVRRSLKTSCGMTTYCGRRYQITVNSDQEWQGQVDTLLHEWAHVVTIEKSYSHGSGWAGNYAEIYCACERNFEEAE